jgi:hypothetical protein
VHKLIAISSALLAVGLLAGPALAGGGCGGCGTGGSCCAQSCAVSQPVFHVEICDKKCKEKEHVDEYVAKVKEIEKDVPSTKLVPVCVKDPCTGCTKTVLQEVCTVEKVKCRVIDITPNSKDEEVEKVYKCATISFDLISSCAAPTCCTH